MFNTSVYSGSKKNELFVLGATSIVFSKLVFFFFDDPEGPNLLVVMGFAAILYFLSLAVYAFLSPANSLKLPLAILAQSVFVIGLYFCL